MVMTDNPTFPKGARVQLRPHLDRWMRGDRYGTVVGVKPNGRVLVLLDRSNKKRAFLPLDLEAL